MRLVAQVRIFTALCKEDGTHSTQLLLKCFYEPPWGWHIQLDEACCYQQCFEKISPFLSLFLLCTCLNTI